MRDSALPPNVEGTVVTVGTFDGVHRGHRDVLDHLAARARDAGLPAVLVSFNPHPLQVLRPEDAPPLLTTRAEKLELLAEAGLRYMLEVPFTRRLSEYTAEQFVEYVLIRRARMRELIIGYDHGFGKGRAGDAEVLQLIGQRRGFSVTVVPPALLNTGRPISSTSVRTAIASADLEAATASLGRPYGITGVVVPGAGRGRGIGYPTLNVRVDEPRKLVPPVGVYAVRAQTPYGVFGGMLNLGPRPTFGEPEILIEAHLFDVSYDFYGASVRIDFLSRIRDVVRFASVDELRNQLAADERAARRALTKWLNSNNINSYTSNPG